MYNDETAHRVLLCYIHWLYDIDWYEEDYLNEIKSVVDWHLDRYLEISDLLDWCWSERVADDDSLILDIRKELNVCHGYLKGYEEMYLDCEEVYKQHVSDMEEESERIDDICTYDYVNDILVLEPRNIYT